MPFGALNPVVQFFLLVWCVIATPIAIILYYATKSKKYEGKLKSKSFLRLVTSFARVTVFPRMFPIGEAEVA